nr:reverse transcriptase domain-containing protein [Tanacetum cinerariifolium]
MPTWCHMFNSTLTGSAMKCIKDLIEIHHIKQREGESTEDFVQRFKAESRHIKGASECMRISGFMHGITNPELIKRLHENIPKSMDEMMKATTAFLRGEVAAFNHVRKKTLSMWKQQEARESKSLKEGEISGINKDQSGDRVARQRITQSFSPNPKISFPRLEDKEGTKDPMINEAEIEGDVEHSTSTCMNFVVVRSPSPYNGIIGRPWVRKIQAVPSITHGMLKFPLLRGILTLWSSKIIPLECIMVFEPKAQPSSTTQAVAERIRVAIHPEYPEQTIAIGSTLTEEGRKALCELLRRNLDIFAWKPEDMTGNLEVYVDDLVIKSRTEQEIMRDIEETFKTLREINMKLNPKNTPSGWRKAYSWDISRTRSRKRGIDDQKGGETNASLFRQPRPARSRNKLHTAGKIDFVVERPEDDPLATITEAKEELLEP